MELRIAWATKGGPVSENVISRARDVSSSESTVCTSTLQVVPCKMEYSETRMRTEDVEGVMVC